MDHTVKNILIIFLIVLAFYLMYALSNLLIPLVLAFLFATLFQPVILLLKKIKLPNWLVLPVISIITLLIAWGLFTILVGTTSDIISQKAYLIGRLEVKLNGFIAWLNQVTGRSYSAWNLDKVVNEIVTSDWFKKAAGNVATGIGSVTGSFVMFALYYVVLLSGMSNHEEFLKYVGGRRKDVFIETYDTIQKSILSYMTTKTLLNITSGTLVTLICLAFGIKFPFFWGLLVLIMSFIPQIGSIISVVPILLMGLIQFDTIQALLFLFLCIESVVFIMGNIVEPKIMGNRLRLNTVTVLFGLVFWAYLWGIPGMMLSVPLMVMLKLTFDHIQSFHVFGRIMGYPEKQSD